MSINTSRLVSEREVACTIPLISVCDPHKKLDSTNAKQTQMHHEAMIVKLVLIISMAKWLIQLIS